jgi:hypothetical protein
MFETNSQKTNDSSTSRRSGKQIAEDLRRCADYIGSDSCASYEAHNSEGSKESKMAEDWMDVLDRATDFLRHGFARISFTHYDVYKDWSLVDKEAFLETYGSRLRHEMIETGVAFLDDQLPEESEDE